MYYQNYEDYMRSVLGYPTDRFTYQPEDSYYYPETYMNTLQNNVPRYI